MIRKITIVLSLLFFTFSFNASAQGYQVDPKFKAYQTNGGPMPQMEIKTLKGDILTNKDLKTNGHLFLMVFNPTCGSCKRMTEMIIENEKYFRNSKVVFLAQPNMASYMQEFLEKTKLDKHPQFIVGYDNNLAIDRIANFKALPMINVYDKNQKLVDVFNGNVPLAYLTKHLP